MLPEYQKCIRNEWFHDHVCLPDLLTGRLIEWEHSMTYKNQRLNVKWAILPLCWWTHRGPGLNKRLNRLIALRRASEAEILRDCPRLINEWKLAQKYEI